MAVIKYQFADGSMSEIEVEDEFAKEYEKIEHRESLINRKETGRHQSLNKSMENGFDIADPTADVLKAVERRELNAKIRLALHTLTDRQRTVFCLYTVNELSFREIGEEMNVAKNTVRECYISAIKKLKKFLQSTLSN